ncbi:FadR/GntR family transcriptional regulator [Agromyces sp. NPDC058104]|uniref:FadR/GntR family transcriptional regulator n=1 Tax=Agromyces sp. NPDC058104 TaxID=3346342 RepID=UPI0036DB78D8
MTSLNAPAADADPKLGARRGPAERLGVGVVHDLVTAIVTGSVQPGELLPKESELCDHFGVSRTVIRESMKRLEEKGLVQVVQGRGTEVSDPSEWNVLDRVVLNTMIENDDELGILDELAVVRAQLESVMAAGVAGAHHDDDLAALTDAHDELVAVRDQQEAFAAADVEFHARLMAISGNHLAQGIARTLTRRARDYSRFYGAPGPEAVGLTIDEHRRILDAIIAGDAEAASREMSEHITQAWARRRIPGRTAE